jgi:hypothetical protein
MDEQISREIIRRNRCNGALNLEKSILSPKIGESIQILILNDSIFPLVTRIYLKGSNIEKEAIKEEIVALIASL